MKDFKTRIEEVEREIRDRGRLSRRTAGDVILLAVCDKCSRTVEFRGDAPVPSFMQRALIESVPDTVEMSRGDEEMTVGDHRRACGGELRTYDDGDLTPWSVH